MALWRRRQPAAIAWLLTTITGTIVQMSLCQAKATLSDNGYRGVVVVIDRDVPEGTGLLRKLEECLTEASKVLFRATKNRLYFEQFVILIPNEWSKSDNYSNAFNSEDSREEILITKRKSEWGDTPYVRNYGACGKPGLYMHLTMTFLAGDYQSKLLGPCGKIIVHEWAHLRWGLFDEYPTEKEKRRPKRRPAETERCSQGSTPVASLMYATNIESITEFCEYSKSQRNNSRHNNQAPNRHNNLCKGKSNWEVMFELPDFHESKPLDSFEQTRPIQFKYVQAQTPRRVLVLDTSGSMMEDNRLTRMNNAASNAILAYMETGSSLGIVRFSSTASVQSQLATIKTEGDRKALTSSLPTIADGGTSIGAGLRLALEILHRGASPASGGTIILVSDGEENRPPMIQDVLPEILQRSVVVHSIGVTQNAARLMSNLSSRTGGKSFFDPGDRNSTALIDSLAAIFVSSGLTHDPSIPLVLQTEAGIVLRDTPLKGEFYIDSTVGHNTTVIVSFTSPVDVTLTGPGNVTISRHTHPQQYVTDISGIIKIDLSDHVQNGAWTYNITAKQVASSHTVITVQSSAKQQGSDVIQVSAWLPEEHDLVFAPDKTLGLYAEVTRGRSSVLNAHVVAVVERPKFEPLRLRLYDNGAGSDIIKDDSIYSGYILAKDLTGDGRYSIKIQVEGVEGLTAVAVGGRGRSSGSQPVNVTEDSEELMTEEVGRFQRVTSAGEFSVNGFPVGMTIVPDLIPPSRITDLTVISNDSWQEAAELEWTSVGGDMDRGTAANYAFYFTSDLDLIASGESNDSMWSEVNETYLHDSKPPQAAGNTERVKVDLALLGDNDTLFLCLRAMDESGNAGELSNFVSITRFREVQEVDVPLQVTDDNRDAGFYVLVTLLPVLAVLALVVTCLLLARRRSRKRKSFRVQKTDETAKSTESPLLQLTPV